jgi:hypothetical protein
MKAKSTNILQPKLIARKFRVLVRVISWIVPSVQKNKDDPRTHTNQHEPKHDTTCSGNELDAIRVYPVKLRKYLNAVPTYSVSRRVGIADGHDSSSNNEDKLMQHVMAIRYREWY